MVVQASNLSDRFFIYSRPLTTIFAALVVGSVRRVDLLPKPQKAHDHVPFVAKYQR